MSMAGRSRKAPIPAWAPLTEGSFKTTMSVLFETSLGDIVIDLEVDSCPKTCENFLRLCKVYYYNLNAFFNGELVSGISYSGHCWRTITVSKDFLARAGDPTATGTGGEFIWSFVANDSSSPNPPPSSHLKSYQNWSIHTKAQFPWQLRLHWKTTRVVVIRKTPSVWHRLAGLAGLASLAVLAARNPNLSFFSQNFHIPRTAS